MRSKENTSDAVRLAVKIFFEVYHIGRKSQGPKLNKFMRLQLMFCRVSELFRELKWCELSTGTELGIQ